MRRRLLVPVLLAAVATGWSQQGSTPDSPPATSPQSPSPQSNSAEQNSGTKPATPSSKTTPTSTQPLPKGMSDDLTFPESDPPPPSPSASSPASHLAPPRSDRVRVDELGPAKGESSSKDTQVDLSPPSDDSKLHPESSSAVANAEAEALAPGGINELHAWDPHRAAKDVEVGDFYFKRKNYRAAEERYRDALRFKDNDAIATIRLAFCLEKLGILDDARSEYESYLRILPHGPQATEAQKAINRLKAETSGPRMQQ